MGAGNSQNKKESQRNTEACAGSAPSGETSLAGIGEAAVRRVTLITEEDFAGVYSVSGAPGGSPRGTPRASQVTNWWDKLAEGDDPRNWGEEDEDF